MNVLVVNAGSSSLKYQLFDTETNTVFSKGICERIGGEGSLIDHKQLVKNLKFKKEAPMPTHADAMKYVVEALTDAEYGCIKSMDEIEAVGHRIVHGGAFFSESTLLTEDVLAKLKLCYDFAPLHTPAHIQGIQGCLAVMPEKPQVLVFDTAFHQTMAPEAYMYALPYRMYKDYGIRRYGAHGTSHRFVAAEMIKLLGGKAEGTKIVTCHIGNGSSISAVKDGKVIDTSMGLTPLDGFAMGTRCGGVDPSAITYIMKKHNISPDEMDKIMNKQSGVLGISGVHSDDRAVKAAAVEGNERAKLARDIQWYQIRKCIGSYIAAMNGVDVIAFTGGIGENCIDLREDVLNNLSYLGIELDEKANEVRGEEIELTKPGCPVRAFVVPTNEELAIARDTKALCE